MRFVSYVNHVDFWDGQLLELITADHDVFFTQIIQHKPNLLIQRPVNRKNEPLLIQKGMPLTVYFHEDSHGLCTFESSVIQYQNNKIEIRKPLINSIEKAQRRYFFRVLVALEMHLILPSSQHSNEQKQISILTHDISGGGVSFLSRDKIVEMGDLVEGALFLKTTTERKMVAFKGKVVYAMKHHDQFYKIALQFVDMKESVRSEIIRFCLSKQIELRKKLKSNPVSEYE